MGVTRVHCLSLIFHSISLRTRGTGNNKPALPPIDLIREFYREEAWALINNKDLWNNIVISYAQAGPIV